MLSKFNSLKQELSSCKSKLGHLKDTKVHNISLQHEISRLNLENESLRDEVFDLKKVIKKWTSSKVIINQLLTKQTPRNIFRALGGRGKRKETISSNKVVFTKADESPLKTILEITSNTEYECENQEPLPPLLKLLGAEPIESSVKVIKRKAQTKSPFVPDFSPVKKADLSTKSINVKRHGMTTYDVFRRRSLDISYFHVFGCPMFIHNHKDHLGKFDEKADDRFFPGYSLMAKAFKVFNIRRQEMKETYHVIFSEDDEAITQSSTEGDFLVPRSKAP
ncbi:hypothetical protein Tco_0932072 [Tanacetum coccineum]